MTTAAGAAAPAPGAGPRSPATDVRGGTTGPDPTTCSRPRNPYPVVGPGRNHNMLWSPRLPPPRPTAASAGFPRGGRRKLQVTSITFPWVSSSRSACPDRSPRSPASSPGLSPPTMSRASRPAAAAAGTRRLSGTTSCMSRPTTAPPAGSGPRSTGPPRAPRTCPPARGVRAGPTSRRGPSRTVQGLLGPVAGVLHIRKGRPRRRIPCFPHDSATLPRTSVFSGRSPMCRADPSAHGRISTVLNAGTFPHDSADPPPAGLGRMCSASPTGPMPHIRPARHQPDTASTTPIPHSPYRAVAPTPGPAPPFLVRKAR